MREDLKKQQERIDFLLSGNNSSDKSNQNHDKSKGDQTISFIKLARLLDF